ncbi:Rhodopsin domain-containing protein [Madurella fahalii]|uniref:Rhodopsin domain-containing protein n=1 Tax=Madurella fahalii TaxID=1157608 RepID=A0ABQ0FWK3_9PEZI
MNDTQPLPPPGLPPLPPNLPHDSLQPNIIASSAICWVVAACFVGLRFYTRGFIIHVIGHSDWSILVALVFAAATCGGVIEQAVHGSGYHIWDLDPTDTESAIAWGRSAWYGILFYNLSLCFSKVSILLLYIHLFSFKWARTAGQVLLVIVILSNIYMMLVTFTACIPLQSYWDFTLTKRYCHSQSIWWSNTGLHMVTDFLIFLLPMPVVWSIKLPRRQKLILSCVFGFGFLVCFISILRLLQLLRAQVDPDFTYVAAELSYLTAVEVNGAIVCACVMTLKPLLAKFFPRVLSSRASRSSSNPNRASDTLVGPPTIGSRPSKAPQSPVDVIDGEMLGKRRAGAWVDGGYVEIDDSWGVDVELAENVRSRRGDDLGTQGRPQNGVVRVQTDITIIKEDK